MSARIVPGTLRDYSWIAANMLADDLAEVMCQVPDGTTSLEIAAWSLAGLEAWTVLGRDGQPVCAFGVTPMTPAGNVLSIWLWGAARSGRTMVEVQRFVEIERVPAWIESGVTRLEARSVEGHTAAWKWLRRLGFELETMLDDWGKDGETFALFTWTLERWLKSLSPARNLPRSSSTTRRR